MCETCGCTVTDHNAHLVASGGKHSHAADGTASVDVLRNLLHENDHQAAHNRTHFDRYGVLAVNLMSSPGSGKTSLLEATARALGPGLRIGVIEGDLETENDAERLRRHGIPAFQITTGTACHLDAHMVHHALHHLPLAEFDIVFIENVGNLVCPASFDLGHHVNAVLLSVTEGDDKPAKYPVMFRAADIMAITKVDLLEAVGDFDPQAAERRLRDLANGAPVLNLSVRREAGLAAWVGWLEDTLKAHRARLGDGVTTRPAVQPDGAALHAAE